MNIPEFLSLIAAMTVLALMPSTSVALVVARSYSAGFRHGCAAAAGIVVGDLTFVLLAIAGMAALSEVLGGFFVVVRYLAGAYLIWFGVSLMMSEVGSTSPLRSHSSPSLSVSFLSGLLLTLGDIKAILFYASFFPAFVDLTNVSAVDVGMVAAITVITVGGVKVGYACFARSAVSLVGGPRAGRAMKVTSGGIMVGAGSYLIARA